MSIDSRPAGLAPQEALIDYFTPDLEQLRSKAKGRPLLYIDPIPKPGRTIRIQAEAFRWRNVTVEPTIAGYGIFAVPTYSWDSAKKGKKLVKLTVIHPGIVYLGKFDANGKPVLRTINPQREFENHIMVPENNFRVIKDDQTTLPPMRKREHDLVTAV